MIVEDFEDLLSYLDKNGMIPEMPDQQLMQKLKQAHKVCLSLAIWDVQLSKYIRLKHVQPFIREIRFDAIGSIPLAFHGYKKSSALIQRSLIENLFNHIYYTDHPVELDWLKGDEKQIIFIDDLCNYLVKLPNFKNLAKRYNIIFKLKSHYSELSTTIHNKPIRNIGSNRVLDDLVVDNDWFIKYLQSLKEVGGLINMALYLFHSDISCLLRREYSSIILSTMTPSERRLCHGII